MYNTKQYSFGYEKATEIDAVEYANSWLRIKGEKRSFDDSQLPSKTKDKFFKTDPKKESKKEIDNSAKAVQKHTNGQKVLGFPN